MDIVMKIVARKYGASVDC